MRSAAPRFLRRWFGRLALGAALVTGALAPTPTHAAPFEVADSTWEGCSEFLEVARTELGSARVRPVAVIDWNDIRPDDGILLLHPTLVVDPDDSAAFMKAGGRLAVLDDHGRGDDILRRFHIERMPLPDRPVAALRNRPAFAIAEPVGDPGAGPHPVVAHVGKLVLNHGTALRHPNLSPVLRVRAIGSPDAIVAVAGQVGKGRLFAMGDPSALINQMLRYPGNRAFAAGLARYLVDEDGASRSRGRLFVVANRFGEEGSFGGESSARKDLEGLARDLRTALDDARREGLPRWVAVLLSGTLLIGLAVWVGRRAGRPYQSPLPRYARPVPLIAQPGIAGRFALLASRSTSRALALLELKSAAYEALMFRFGLSSEPNAEGLLDRVRRAGTLDEPTYSAFKEVLRNMHRVESILVTGRPAAVTEPELARAHATVIAVLRQLGADVAALRAWKGPEPEPAPPPLDEARGIH